MNSEGKAYGIGVIVYNDGAIHEGFFKQGKRSGFATEFFANGDYFIGMYKPNYVNGEIGDGQMFYANGTSAKGCWQ